MKAQGNITQGKTIDRHITEGTLRPYSVVRFYGPTTPAEMVGKDVYVTGWRNSPTGGYIFTLVTHVGETFATTPFGRKGTDKVGVYVDQEDAKVDYGYGTVIR
jgi:hypothetical protein